MRTRWACRAGAVALALAFGGCTERRAGTEVGNPEVTVAAVFRVFNYTGTVRTSALYFRVMGLGYAIARPSGLPDTGKCWFRPGGTLANFAAADSVPLKDTLIRDEGTWPQAEIILRTPEGPAGLPDSADFRTWSNPRYAKFTWFTMWESRQVLFEMPQGVEYRLLFDSISVQSWRFGDEIEVPFEFEAELWTDTLSVFPGFTTRLDGLGNPYTLFSPTENAAAWNALKARLPRSFYADSVIVR